MAIDTAAKRKSCIGLALPFGRLGVIPDGSNLSAAQRLHVQGLYAGIAASAGGALDRSGASALSRAASSALDRSGASALARN